VAAGLAAAHAAGVIHRDLKPSNILIGADGHARVGDFGIAHLEAMTELTRTGEVLGTPRYIAPEQVTGGVDARSDVYALGVVLYEMAVGHPPFDGDSPLEIVSKHLRERPVPPRRLVPTLGKRFESVVLRALEKDPAKRLATAAALRDALRPVESAPLVAFASRGSRVPAQGRAAGALVAALAVLFLLAGAAVARVGSDAWRPFAPPSAVAAASPTPSATAPPTTAARAATLTPSPEPTAVPLTPTPRAATPTTPTLTAPPLIPARTSAPAADEAAAVVARFYQLVTADRFDEAAALWSARMRAAYPPATNIYGRFSSTRTISLNAWSVASASATNATINVNIVEVMNDGSVRRWVGQWYVVRSGGAWLMDQPALARA
jgi:serine/threonine-protein kinase